MTISRLSIGFVTGAVLVIVLLAVGVSPVTAQITELELTVDSVVGFSDQQGVRIPVYMDNFFDSVAAFQFWIHLDRPDIMRLSIDTITVYDTSYWECLNWSGPDCIDSIQVSSSGNWDFFHVDSQVAVSGQFDTTGTLSSGWELVATRSLGGSGFELLVTGIADLLGGGTVPAIPPQNSGVPLIYLFVDVLTLPDSMHNETVKLLVETDFLDHFCFSTPLGQCIGFVDCVYVDTNYYLCTQWIEDTICLNWQQVSGPPADSIEIVLDTFTCLDTLAVQVHDGLFTFLMCGDPNGSDEINVQDLSDLVNYLFRPPYPIHPEAANVDGIIGPGGPVDVGDLSYFVNYLFKGGPPPQCY